MAEAAIAEIVQTEAEPQVETEATTPEEELEGTRSPEPEHAEEESDEERIRRESREAEVEERVEARLAEERQRQTEQSYSARLEAAKTKAKNMLPAILRAAQADDPDEVFQPRAGELRRIFPEVVAAVEEGLGAIYHEAFFRNLPEAEREDYAKEVDGKALDDWLKGFSERVASSTNVFKKLEREHKKALEKAFDDGREKGHTDPIPEPKAGDTGGAGRTYTLAEIDAMPTSQWMNLGDKATRDRILEQAHQVKGD